MKPLISFVAVASFCAIPGFCQDVLKTKSIRKPAQVEATGTTAASASLPTWSASSGTYTYTMVGQNPMTALANPSTTVTVPIVPLRLVFSDGTTLDPTAVDATCSPAGTPLSLLESSPLFNNSAYTPGGTSAGTTQYEDFFRRANFWQYTGPTGINPGYHLLLSPSPQAAVTITVPASQGHTVAAACGKMGEVELGWLDTYLQSTVYPKAGILPTQFPLFLLYNVVTFDSSDSGSLILGYHSAFSNSVTAGAMQVYAVGEFDTTGSFGVTKDISDITHEIGEAMDDPTGNNPTPAWGNVGQVTGCQNNLEVGDPLSGTDTTVTMANSYVYHVQELAFVSWFYHDSPSKGVNGWYSSNGTFTTPAAACGKTATTATKTTLTLGATSITAGTEVSFNVVVSPVSGTASPTGNVTLSTSTGTKLGAYTLNDSTASGSIALPTGTYSVIATYDGGATFASSVSAPVAVTVTSATPQLKPTVTTLSIGSASASAILLGNTVTSGGSATVSIQVRPSSGTGTPTGTVALVTSTGTTIATETLANGIFNGTVTLPSGTYTVTAKYSGDASFAASTSNAVSAAPAPVAPASGLTVTPTSLTFASTAVGSASASQKITVTNTATSGQTSLLLLPGGADPLDFTVQDGCGFSLAAGKSCTVTVTFKPLLAGARTATLQFGGLGFGNTVKTTVTFSGTATGGPQLTVSKTSLSFGSSVEGTATAAQTVTISNTGTGTLEGLLLSLGGADGRDFPTTSKCGLTLAAGASCTVSVTFDPRTTGSLTAALEISALGSATTDSVTLTGTGTAK